MNNKIEYQELYMGEQETDHNYNHYIQIDVMSYIRSGWSDGPYPEIDISDAISIGVGSYQFRLFPDGEENPNLFTHDMIPLYKWDGTQVVVRSEEEIEADRAELAANQPVSEPTEQEKIRADLDYVMLMMGMDVDPN